MALGIISPASAYSLADLLAVPNGGIASRVLAKNGGGNVTLFAFDQGEGLSEHTSPFDALVLTLDGHLRLTIGGQSVQGLAGTITNLPANVPHAVEAVERSRMLLIMLREPKSA
jgi:quercetin dioxygenase-like cupin family protein